MIEKLLQFLCFFGCLFIVMAFTHSTYSPYGDGDQNEVLAVILLGSVLSIGCGSLLINRNSVKK